MDFWANFVNLFTFLLYSKDFFHHSSF